MIPTLAFMSPWNHCCCNSFTYMEVESDSIYDLWQLKECSVEESIIYLRTIITGHRWDGDAIIMRISSIFTMKAALRSLYPTNLFTCNISISYFSICQRNVKARFYQPECHWESDRWLCVNRHTSDFHDTVCELCSRGLTGPRTGLGYFAKRQISQDHNVFSGLISQIFEKLFPVFNCDIQGATLALLAHRTLSMRYSARCRSQSASQNGNIHERWTT